MTKQNKLTKIKTTITKLFTILVFSFLLNSVMRRWMDTIFDAIDRHF